jgi:four helix bundle protein
MKNDKEKLKPNLNVEFIDGFFILLEFLDALPKDTTTQRIVDQLFRSGASIGANYIEAQASSSRKDFTNFLHHALKSANESKFWLAILRDTNRGNLQKIKWLLEELCEIANILGSSLLTVKGRK